MEIGFIINLTINCYLLNANYRYYMFEIAQFSDVPISFLTVL